MDGTLRCFRMEGESWVLEIWEFGEWVFLSVSWTLGRGMAGQILTKQRMTQPKLVTLNGCLEKWGGGRRIFFLGFWKIFGIFWSFRFAKEACSMGGIQKGAHRFRMKPFFSPRQPKKQCQKSVWYFQFPNQLFWFTQDLYTVCVGLSFHTSPAPHGIPFDARGAGFDPAKTIPVMIDVGCTDASGNAAKFLCLSAS